MQKNKNGVFSGYLHLLSYRKGSAFMQITDIRVRKVNSVGKMTAVVSVTLDECFVVHDIKVIEGKERLFIAMPSRKTAEGEFKDIAHPINTELRDQLQTMILAKYEEALAELPTDTEEQAYLDFAYFLQR